MSGPAAILDIDGTLVDSNYQHAIAWPGPRLDDRTARGPIRR
jgi:phosphoglycolate phosphatase-like HAD superfamily hydrolase